MEHIKDKKAIIKDMQENPCDYCHKAKYCEITCHAWKEGFKRRWAGIYAYGEKAIPIYQKHLEEQAKAKESEADE